MRWTDEQDRALMDKVDGYINTINENWDVNATEVTRKWFFDPDYGFEFARLFAVDIGRPKTGPSGLWKRYQYLLKRDRR